MKIILTAKLDENCIHWMVSDEVARSILPVKKNIYIAICEDGRKTTPTDSPHQNVHHGWPGCTIDLAVDNSHESQHLRNLYWKELEAENVEVHFIRFSFFAPVDQQLAVLERDDIFYFTGFAPQATLRNSPLCRVFEVLNSGNRDLPGHGVSKLRWKVQFNNCLFIGTCAGAIMAGKAWQDVPCLDLFQGIAVCYDACTGPSQPHTTDENVIQVTSGCAVAINIWSNTAAGSVFANGGKQRTAWKQWAAVSTQRLQPVVESLRHKRTTYFWQDFGCWWYCLSGACGRTHLQ